MTDRRMKNSKKRGMFLKVGFILYFGFCLFSTVWLRASVVNLEYEIGALNELKTDLVRERKIVMAHRASSFSLEKIEGVAMERLGMTLPERENVYFVKRTMVAAPYRTSN